MAKACQKPTEVCKLTCRKLVMILLKAGAGFIESFLPMALQVCMVCGRMCVEQHDQSLWNTGQHTEFALITQEPPNSLSGWFDRVGVAPKAPGQLCQTAFRMPKHL